MNKPLALPEIEWNKDIVSSKTVSGFVQFVFTAISKVLMPIFWAHIEVLNQPPKQSTAGILLLANHKSYYDALIVGNSFPLFSKFRPIRFFSKDELFLKPLSRLFFTLAGAFPAYYGAGLARSLKIPKRLLEQNQVVCMFPEGRCVRDETLGEGKTGAAVLAQMVQGVKIVPMGIRGAYKIRWGFLKLPTVRVAFGEPFALRDKIDVTTATKEQITELFMAEIAAVYSQL